MNQFTKQLAILFIALTSLQSCDVEKFIDTNIKEKSLVVIAPDFIQNRVAIVFEDADTGALIEEDLEVRLIASEMLIDLAGNYKNDFTAKKGLLNFAIDPNANNSEPVTLNIDAIYNKSGDKMATYQETFKLDNSSNNTVLRIPLSIQNSVNQGVSKSENVDGKTEDLFFLTMNGKKANSTNDIFPEQDFFIDRYVSFDNPTEGVAQFKLNTLNEANWDYLNYTTIKVEFIDLRSGKLIRHQYDNNGSYLIEEYESSVNGVLKRTKVTGGFIENYTHSFTINNVKNFLSINFQIFSKTETFICYNGYNLSFNGLEEGDKPSFNYKVVMNNESFIPIKGFAIPTKKSPENSTTQVIDSHLYGRNSNKIVFEENPHYVIEPQEMELGGKDSCGKRYNFKVYPRDGHNRYTLNLQFQCDGEEFSTAPSLTAFLKEEESSTSKSIIRLENGSTSLVLKPEAAYSVQGSFNETEFGFTFTANESQIEQAIAKTIAENSNIKDIEYTISKINNVESVINAKIIFKEGACPE